MHLATAIATVVAEAEQENVALQTLPFGLVALAAFGALALVAASYRNVSNRQADASESAYGHGEVEHGH
ncbi:hypothetical protein N8K70_08065 [Microbacterium betulae]|uniref:4-hydroxybenzoate polyprenyltransferase n=1 Tax=Microbacterium betulae TaxID=2981139 RepID=A0AA97I7T0_9MICO|nr:hypothetical protein [Microbacterium sp. AB]WOF24597.1 hypothetical protein N8K70_08065 [Microbacterium sp. AB]